MSENEKLTDPRDAEIARLQESVQNLSRAQQQASAAWLKTADLVIERDAEIARLTAERDALIRMAERLERALEQLHAMLCPACSLRREIFGEPYRGEGEHYPVPAAQEAAQFYRVESDAAQDRANLLGGRLETAEAELAEAVACLRARSEPRTVCWLDAYDARHAPAADPYCHMAAQVDAGVARYPK